MLLYFHGVSSVRSGFSLAPLVMARASCPIRSHPSHPILFAAILADTLRMVTNPLVNACRRHVLARLSLVAKPSEKLLMAFVAAVMKTLTAAERKAAVDDGGLARAVGPDWMVGAVPQREASDA